MGIPGEEEGTEWICQKIMAENFASLGREIDIKSMRPKGSQTG